MALEFDDEDDNIVRIKTDGDYFRKSVEVEHEDPFTKSWDELQKIDGLSTNFKRKANRMLQKSFTGVDDAKSKKLDPLDLTGYSLFMIVQPPYNMMYLSQLFDLSPFHHAAVEAKVANIIGLGYDFKETKQVLDRVEDVIGDPTKLDKLRKKISKGREDLKDYLESMNSDDGFLETMKKICTDLETTGNAYLEIGRTSSGKIGYIGHIPTITMRIRRHRDGFVQVVYNRYTFFRNYGDTVTEDQIGTDPRPNEVIHFKIYTPTNTYYGIPDIIAAKNAIAGDEFAQRYNLDYFENKAVPRYIITVKGAKLNADSERKLLEFFQTGLRGRNHRTLYIPLPSDGEQARVEFDMKAIEAGIQDSSFKEYAVESRDRILLAHRVPISKIGTPQGMSLAGARDADKTFKEQVCRPRQDYFEHKLKKVISEITDMFTLEFNELTLTDEETQARIDDVYLKDQVITPNDVRLRRGLSPRPGGDDPLVIGPKAAAEEKTQQNGTRQRDQKRKINAPDIQGEARNPKGEGRTQS
jgi:PBSX family phage portal protein